MSEVFPHSAFQGTGGSAGPTVDGGAAGYTAPHPPPSHETRRLDASIGGWDALMRALAATLPTSLARCNRARRALLRASYR